MKYCSRIRGRGGVFYRGGGTKGKSRVGVYSRGVGMRGRVHFIHVLLATTVS